MCTAQGTDLTKAFFKGLCSVDSLASLASELEEEEGESLEFGLDVNAVRFKGGVRETLNEDEADSETLLRLHHKEGCTLQYHQPQRFEERLWLLCSALEEELGCLVGSNAYLTPKGSQGLAPHHDDVELWVCQTVGSKSWKLYQPFQGHQLPNTPSPDLDPKSIGKPILEVTLKQGDILYMPRGTVHQAAAQSEDSAHVTISTYQRQEGG